MLSLSDIISQAWRFYTKNFETLIPYMALLFLPTALLSALGLVGMSIDKFLPNSIIASNIIIFIIFLASLIFSFWATIALIKGLAVLLQNPARHAWRASFSYAAPLFWPFAFTSFLVGLVIMAGTLLFIIPGIIFALWYAFAGYAVMLDGQTGLAAMRFSKGLVVGRWWSIALRLVIPSLLFGALFMAAYSLVAFPLTLYAPADPALIINNLLSALGKAVLTPLTAVAMIIVYLDAKRVPVEPTILPTQKP